jgi:hypothetical protein
MLLFSIGACLLSFAAALILPSDWRTPKAVLGLAGSALGVPILCLFFRIYHATVPMVFQSRAPDSASVEADEELAASA